MSGKTFFISDLHLGHKRILEFSPERQGPTIADHNQWLINNWNSVVSDEDTIFVLGDVAFGSEALKLVAQLKGKKILIRGNHDKQSTHTYLEYFQDIYGIYKLYKEFWLSHAPIHPQELRGKINIHGHSHREHMKTPEGNKDYRYVNVSVEALDGKPISLGQIRGLLSIVKEDSKTTPISFKINNSSYLQSLTVVKEASVPISVYVADAKSSLRNRK